MKKLFPVIPFILLLTFSATRLWSQANTELSNLVAPTKVNVNLQPTNDNNKNLGSASKSWKDFYLDGYLYLDGSQWLANPGSNNTMVGSLAGTNTTGAENTFIGTTAGVYNTTGYSNTFTGADAGWKNTTGYENIFIGTDAGYNNVTGIQNVAIGAGALVNNNRDGQTAVGYHALYSSVGEISFDADNSAFGAFSLEATTTGYGNSAFGSNSLSNNTEGRANSAFGAQSLLDNTAGIANSAFGSSALLSNTGGNENTAMGVWALKELVEGDNNSAFGSYALGDIGIGSNNTGVGAWALNDHDGDNNSAFGYQALLVYSLGNNNCAFGTRAGYYQQDEDNCVYIGYESGHGPITGFNGGSDNSFVGTQSGYSNKEGEANCFFGSHAGYANTSANYGTFVGYDAGGNNTTGSQNTYLGYSTEGSSGTYTNVVGIGYQLTNTASNQARIGNSSTTSIGGWAGWSNVSDGRFKKNVREEVAGLAFINKLRPVIYNLDLHAVDEFIGKEFTQDHETDASAKISEQAKNEKEKIIYSGFIAQEVESAAKEIGYDFSGVDAPKNEKDLYGLRYAEFVVPLVKAVQELDENDDVQTTRLAAVEMENEKLKMENSELKARLDRIESQLGFTGELKQSSGIANGATLEQNIPNPAKNTTTIGFYIPSEASNAQLIITDASGKTIQQFNNLMVGQSQVEISISHLSSGTYQYSLYVDGKKVDTRQMIISK